MNRTTAVETWREVCGSDTVMAMMPPTGRMLEEFAERIAAAEREACAEVCRKRALKMREKISFDVLEQVQMILASAVQLGMDVETLRFVELAILVLKAEEIARGGK